MSKPRRRGGLSTGTSTSNSATATGDTTTSSSSTNPISSSTLAAASTGSSFLFGGGGGGSTVLGGRVPRSTSKVTSGKQQKQQQQQQQQEQQEDPDYYEETLVGSSNKGGRKKKRKKRGSTKEDLSSETTTTTTATVGRPKGGGGISTTTSQKGGNSNYTATATTTTNNYDNLSPSSAAAASAGMTSGKGTTSSTAAAASSNSSRATTKKILKASTTTTTTTSAAAAAATTATSKKGTSTTTTKDGESFRNDTVTTPIYVDPGSLTRGMTARRIGTSISSMVSILNSQQIQSDLELMDAFNEACRTYAQKYFAYRNPELCRIMEDGTTVEYVGIQQLYTDTTTTTTTTTGDTTTAVTLSNNAELSSSSSPPTPTPNITSPSQQPQQPHMEGLRARLLCGAQQLMPVRIDPEEEKRIAALRQLISTQEKQREELETQYVSLHSNYIRELQLLEAARHENKFVVQFLQQLCHKRAKALSLRRIRCQIVTDILTCLQWRRIKIEENENIMQVERMERKNSSTTFTGDNNIAPPATADNDVVMNDVTVETEEETEDKKVLSNVDPKETIEGLYEMWDLLENELVKAEADCTNVDIPDGLLGDAILAQLIRDPPPRLLTEAAVVIEKDVEKVPTSSSNGGSCKDNITKSSDADASTTKVEKRKYRRRAMSCGSLEDNVAEGTKKSNNLSKEEDAAPSKATSGFTTTFPSLTLPLSANNINNKHAIPWRSLTIQRTPRGVPLYISQLSNYPDKVAGAGYGGFLGNTSMDMRYLLPLDRIHGCDNTAYGLPGSLNSKAIEMKEMARLEMEISHLEASIDEERLLNDKLKTFAIERKRKADDICTAMVLLRSETENVLLRHNIILNSKEARMKSCEVVKEGRRDDASSNPSQVSDNHDEEEMEEEEEDFDAHAEAESCEAGAEEEGQAPDDEDDLDESEPENTTYENQRDKEELGDTDADDEVEGDEEENVYDSVDGGEEDEEEEEEDEEEDDAEDPPASRSTRIVIRSKANRPASDSDDDLEEEEEDDTDVDTGADDDQISANEEDMNPSGDEYSEDEGIECNGEGNDSGGEEERGCSLSSEDLEDNSNIDEDAEDEDEGSEIDGEELDDDEYESSEQLEVSEI